jgi:hypothetical protein
MRERPHFHACQQCQNPTECHGELEPNHDGEPRVRCRVFHLDGGQVDSAFLCDECVTKAEAEARDNAEPPDMDGEEMFRDYAAELRDSMDAARKLK